MVTKERARSHKHVTSGKRTQVRSLQPEELDAAVRELLRLAETGYYDGSLSPEAIWLRTAIASRN
jgi:hypothetical protein